MDKLIHREDAGEKMEERIKSLHGLTEEEKEKYKKKQKKEDTKPKVEE